MERAQKAPHVLVVLLAGAFVVAAIWAATALAGGGGASASGNSNVNVPAIDFVQSAPDDTAPSADNCPDRQDDGSGGGGSGGSSDSSGSGSQNF